MIVQRCNFNSKEEDIYDDGMMNMYLRAVAETAARRKTLFEQLSDRAVEAFNKKQWSLVICYVNDAFETQYYNGELYYLRGYAFEMLFRFPALENGVYKQNWMTTLCKKKDWQHCQSFYVIYSHDISREEGNLNL